MKNFKISKQTATVMLISVICAFVLIIVCPIIIANGYHRYKFECTLMTVCSAIYVITIIFTITNTISEVILNEDFMCINRASVFKVNSEIIKYSDIYSVSYTEVELTIPSRTIAIIELNTKTGTKKISKIENAEQCAELIDQKIKKD